MFHLFILFAVCTAKESKVIRVTPLSFNNNGFPLQVKSVTEDNNLKVKVLHDVDNAKGFTYHGFIDSIVETSTNGKVDVQRRTKIDDKKLKVEKINCKEAVGTDVTEVNVIDSNKKQLDKTVHENKVNETDDLKVIPNNKETNIKDKEIEKLVMRSDKNVLNTTKDKRVMNNHKKIFSKVDDKDKVEVLKMYVPVSEELGKPDFPHVLNKKQLNEIVKIKT